eukprot:UN07844
MHILRLIVNSFLVVLKSSCDGINTSFCAHLKILESIFFKRPPNTKKKMSPLMEKFAKNDGNNFSYAVLRFYTQKALKFVDEGRTFQVEVENNFEKHVTVVVELF